MLEKLKNTKKRKIVVKMNAPFLFMTLWLLGLYVIFMKTAMTKDPGLALQGSVAFITLFLPPCVFAYMSGFWNGSEENQKNSTRDEWVHPDKD